MAEPHTCPRCEGERKAFNARSGRAEACPTCRGSGVVWDRGVQEAAEPSSVEDPLDLTYSGS